MTAGEAELRQRWRQAEQRLYPMIMVAPESYATYVRLVRSMADELGTCATQDELVDAYPNRSAIVEGALASVGISGSGLDLELAADAAFQLRFDEVERQLHRDEVGRRIADMQGRAGWVVLTETALVGGQIFPPYRRLEMHLPDGTGLDITVELNLETGHPLYAVEVVQLDPASGGALPGADSGERQTFSERPPWEQAIAALRGGESPVRQH